MVAIAKSPAKSIAKQEKMKEIISLLQNHGSLKAVEIVDLSNGLTLTAVNRYLAELTLSGHVRKVRAQGGPKNIRAYQFHSEYGAKTDIVSLALSHPLHRLTLTLVKKNYPIPCKQATGASHLVDPVLPPH